jgi:hypothetical protein
VPSEPWCSGAATGATDTGFHGDRACVRPYKNPGLECSSAFSATGVLNQARTTDYGRPSGGVARLDAGPRTVTPSTSLHSNDGARRFCDRRYLIRVVYLLRSQLLKRPERRRFRIVPGYDLGPRGINRMRIATPHLRLHRSRSHGEARVRRQLLAVRPETNCYCHPGARARCKSSPRPARRIGKAR